MKYLTTLGFMLFSLASHVETLQQIGQRYAAEAATSQPGFTPSARRGATLFQQHFAVNYKMPACTTCHTDTPLQSGQHAITGKAIRPLAVAANGNFGEHDIAIPELRE